MKNVSKSSVCLRAVGILMIMAMSVFVGSAHAYSPEMRRAQVM